MSEQPLRPLEDKILEAFKHAYEARRFDVAEHLLRALEALQAEPRPGTALRDAYLMLRPRENSN